MCGLLVGGESASSSLSTALGMPVLTGNPRLGEGAPSRKASRRGTSKRMAFLSAEKEGAQEVPRGSGSYLAGAGPRENVVKLRLVLALSAPDLAVASPRGISSRGFCLERHWMG